MTSTASSLRGGAVGALVVSTAVAAHGLAGGGFPAGSSFVFLLVVGIGVGTVVSVPQPRRDRDHAVVLFGGLALGQLAAHVALAVGSAHEMAHGHTLLPSPSMLAFHVLAAVLGGVLVHSAERLYGPITSIVRAVLEPPLPLPDASAPGRIGAASYLHVPRHPFTTTISRRGPPQ
ncbi:hypothetical protein [Rhodococcoides kyotonense]|uniref:Uncharacterized protein n=1 Tax=Rhodococcoides kyotonense TaxID=398843 RepID=A0A239L9U8_9NOCA|nr:hypothetical protein [Rhodococcus kyotonensis]SNT26623.1 hypothetical protein SAMN05421642_112108 [Rhodococcus kyotonensis]